MPGQWSNIAGVPPLRHRAPAGDPARGPMVFLDGLRSAVLLPVIHGLEDLVTDRAGFRQSSPDRRALAPALGDLAPALHAQRLAAGTGPPLLLQNIIPRLTVCADMVDVGFDRMPRSFLSHAFSSEQGSSGSGDARRIVINCCQELRNGEWLLDLFCQHPMPWRRRAARSRRLRGLQRSQ